jgi:hypothetical protein
MAKLSSFYARNLSAITFIAIVPIWVGFVAFRKAAAIEHGTGVLVLGLACGAIPIVIELIIAWRKGRLFIRDKAEIMARQSRNKQLARNMLWPAAGLGVTLSYFPAGWQIFLLAVIAGYLLPFSIALIIHFVKNHREIESITRH